MSRNLKVLGLALVAAMALTAVMASAASATEHDPAKFTVANGAATLSATQVGVHKFTVTGQTVTCVTADFTSGATGTEPTSVAVEATYDECKSEPLGASATVSGFGKVGEEGKCWYVLKADGGAELKCKNGEVTVTALTCQAHVPEQSFTGGVTYTTGTLAGGKHDLDVSFHITGITATHTDGFLCPFGSSGLSHEGILEGEATASALVGETPVDVTHHPTQNT